MRGRWSMVGAGAVAAASVALAFVGTPGCANIWGFRDLSLEDAGAGDATSVTSDAAGGANDGEAADCEGTNTPDNCGACGFQCGTQHAMAAHCIQGKCSYDCQPGWGDCDQTGANLNGCEADLTSPTSCGSCTNVCNTDNSTHQFCDGVTCSYTCKNGYLDCNTKAPDTDGCEVQVDGGESCAVCGEPGCDATNSVDAATCHMGAGTSPYCTYAACAPGFADCNKTPPDTHGCSTATTTVDNCGGCGVACDTTRSTVNGCDTTSKPDAATCTYSGCAAGWADCDAGGANADGCETWTHSLTACGGCGAACDTSTGTPTCDGTTCTYACHGGRTDCNVATTPDTDGCECATPGCCAGGKCQTVHSNGVGNGFYDCNSPGDYAWTQALAACQAAGATDCTPSTKCCGNLLNLLCLSSTAYAACGTVGDHCDCWQYAGTGQTTPNAPGTVQVMPSGTCSAACASSSDPKWN